jgi:kinesin family protein 18/19
MKRTIHRLFQGYNSTILAYGMTGSGKTYTMFGDLNAMSVVETNPGLIILSVKDIFWKIHRELNEDADVRFRIKISFLEIYNETVKDLLSETESFLNILEDSNKDAIIPNLTEVLINEPHDVLALIEKGNAKRTMAETSANRFSSRSHAIFTIYLEKLFENKNEIISGKLALVDLAGSERACVSMNIGKT